MPKNNPGYIFAVNSKKSFEIHKNILYFTNFLNLFLKSYLNLNNAIRPANWGIAQFKYK